MRSLEDLSPFILCPVLAIYAWSFPAFVPMLPALFGHPSFYIFYPHLARPHLARYRRYVLCLIVCSVCCLVLSYILPFLPIGIPMTRLGHGSLSKRVELLVDFDSYVFSLTCELIPNNVFRSHFSLEFSRIDYLKKTEVVS